MPITALPTPPSRTDAANFSARADAFLGALPTFGSEANALAVEVNGYATNAAASAATAVNAPGTSATSTTPLAISTGSKSLTVQTGKAFVVGQWVTITSTATPTNWMHGQITAYTSGTGALVVNVAMVGGSGTIAAWAVALSAPSVSGNAVLTTSTYADPAWLTSLAGSKITGTLAVANGGTGAADAATARSNLQRAGVTHVDVRVADGSAGAASDGPFDAIVLGGSVSEVPQVLLQQLKHQGRLIAIVGQDPIMSATLFTRTGEATWETHALWDTQAPRLQGFAEPSRFHF